MKYVEMSKQVLELVGGIQNVKFVEHCATRLRIHFIKKSLVDIEKIKEVENVVGIVEKTGQIQIIIGPEVHEAYTDFLEVSGFENKVDEVQPNEEEPENKNVLYYMRKFGDASAAVFMPIVPALITGGLILSINNLLVNYFGLSSEGGTAQIFLAIFNAGFTYLPIYIGFTLAKKLKMEPIMGAFLGAVLVSPAISGVEGLSFLGVTIPLVSYASSVMPIVLGVILMYFVDHALGKIIPEAIKYFIKPLLLMVIVTPITLIALGPLGTYLSTFIGSLITGMMDSIGGLAMPLLSAIYPYLVMFGLDKGMMPIGISMFMELGYEPLGMVMGFISNLCVGGSALAIASTIKNDQGKKGMFASFGVTALCGVTEPAFYGALLSRPKALLGTAIGALCGGLVAGIFVLKSYVMGGCPGLLTALFFLPPDGTMGNLILAAVVAIVSITVSFLATKILLTKTKK